MNLSLAYSNWWRLRDDTGTSNFMPVDPVDPVDPGDMTSESTMEWADGTTMQWADGTDMDWHDS